MVFIINAKTGTKFIIMYTFKGFLQTAYIYQSLASTLRQNIIAILRMEAN